jgi:hypothetical protein
MDNPETFFRALKEVDRVSTSAIDNWRGGILWEISLHWVYKLKWGGKGYKIPFKKNLASVVELHGTAMFRLLNLCEQCHPFQKYGYESGLAWFFWIINTDLIPQSYAHNRTKTDRVSSGWQEISTLKENRNPFDLETERHLWRVIEQSTKMTNTPKFEEDYWKPFIAAYSRWISALKSPDWKTVVLDGDDIRIKPGRGKGTIKLTQNLKSLPHKAYKS